MAKNYYEDTTKMKRFYKTLKDNLELQEMTFLKVILIAIAIIVGTIFTAMHVSSVYGGFDYINHYNAEAYEHLQAEFNAIVPAENIQNVQDIDLTKLSDKDIKYTDTITIESSSTAASTQTRKVNLEKGNYSIDIEMKQGDEEVTITFDIPEESFWSFRHYFALFVFDALISAVFYCAEYLICQILRFCIWIGFKIKNIHVAIKNDIKNKSLQN